MNKINNSSITTKPLLVLFSAVVMLLPSSLLADSVIQMNLREMFRRADKVFRGTVVSATPGTLKVGGGELPVVTYRIMVDEAFKGDFQAVKGVRFIEIRMVGALKHKMRGQSHKATHFSGVPRLEIGQRYLLLTTRPSVIGMSSPVGLGQGSFRIKGEGESEETVNEYGNKMLFRGMEPATRQSDGARLAGGPMKYSHLAGEIRRLVDEERRKR